jgi:hypothetical protein
VAHLRHAAELAATSWPALARVRFDLARALLRTADQLRRSTADAGRLRLPSGDPVVHTGRCSSWTAGP